MRRRWPTSCDVSARRRHPLKLVLIGVGLGEERVVLGQTDVLARTPLGAVLAEDDRPAPHDVAGGRERVEHARAGRVRHRHVRDAARAEEARGSPISAVDDLIDQHERSGCQLFAERPARRQRDQIGDLRERRGGVGAVCAGALSGTGVTCGANWAEGCRKVGGSNSIV